ncbi:uncharacterized protein LOC135713456 [Ochlerotatus camptorhynchus]|uniref:uncharacterized protein LOC135713456 n=1 Tax=Ochlerotatus camptorhynchus TaxID=644619 RepID=UPI0031D793D5
MDWKHSSTLTIALILSALIPPVAPWYYNCFQSSEDTSSLLSNSCSLKDIVVRSDIDAQDVYFPPTNINFFQSNFSSFSPVLGRRLPDEAEKVNFFNCMVSKFAIPTGLRVLGVYFTNVALFYSNYRMESAMEELSVVGARITSVRFVEVFRKLRYLRVEGNPIRLVVMETFRNLTEVEVINLSGNQIITIEPTEKPLELPKLVELNLRRNFLIELDSSLWYSPSLQILTLHTNFLKSLNVEELHRSFPRLTQVTLSRNHWNCKRLNVILGSMLIRNITFYEPDARVGCHSFEYLEYMSFSEQDAITNAKRVVERLETVSAEYYEEMRNTTVLEDLQQRSDILRRKLDGMNDVVWRVMKKYGEIKLWVLSTSN